MQLYNKLSAIERAALIDEAGKDRLTISFYQYYKIENPQLLRDKLFLEWNALDVLGRIYVSFEGINAQLSVPSENFYALKDQLDTISFLRDIRLNVAVEQDNKSFLKLKVKVRNKIVADGLNDETFDVTNKGVHLNAEEFNKMLANPDTVCVDMRNHYESEIGHFDGAVTPDVDTFRDSLDVIEEDLKDNKEDKNLLMYCTGGIRCEKASSFMKAKGFNNIFHLQGGILNYIKKIDEEHSLWEGECFVFDDRVALNQNLEVGLYDMCHGCRMPITEEDKVSPKYNRGISCPNCFDSKTPGQQKRYADRIKQIDLAKKRGERHIGSIASSVTKG